MSKDSTLTSKRRQPTRRPRLQSPMIWVIALGIIAAVIAIASTQNSTSNTATVEVAFAETHGNPLPSFATPDPAIGLRAPSIKAHTFEGDEVQITADGTARLIGFFAHWCPHCQTELPAATEWLESNSLPDGVEVVAISTAVDPQAANYPPSDWFARERWPGTVVADDSQRRVAAGFGLTAFPFWVAVDGDGMVIARIAGSLGENDFAALVRQIAPSP